MKHRFVLPLIILILVSGCVQEKRLTEFSLPGHTETYTFTHDIRESYKVPFKGEGVANVKKLDFHGNVINFVFNGSSSEDNKYFSVVVFNIVAKLQPYFAYEGRLMRFPVYYFLPDGWYNSTNEKIEKPNLKEIGPILWLIGPNTGANETSLTLEGNIIYLRGTSYENLTMAADKFVLLVMGVTPEDVEKMYS